LIQRQYDVANGIQAFQVAWTSKASAAQRAGRAGRTGPGHCYRLYSSALFEHHFEKFAIPEIQRMPIDGLVLQMKSMHIDTVVNFPFPTPPERPALLKAEKTLVYLGALHISSSPSGLMEGQISELGRAMALFPLSPRFSRMLVSGQQHGCLPYVICIVSAMSVGDPFIYEEAIDNEDSEDSEEDQELGDLKGEAVGAKEKRRLLRKAFFQSHQVSIPGAPQ
jgi:ATP-dependent RNA helicase DHX37/DHR1